MIQGVRRPRVSIFLAPWLLLIVFQDPGATAERLRRGVELLEARAVAAAVVELEAAVALDPKNVSARYHLGLAFFLTGELDAAVTQLKEALKGESDTGRIQFLLGQVHLEARRFEAAQDALIAAEAAMPDYAPVSFHRAELCYRLGRVEGAKARFGALTRDAPDWVAPFVRLGAIGLEEGNGEEAGAWLEQAVQLQPRNPALWMRLASAQTLLDQGLRALESTRKAVELSPDSLPGRSAMMLRVVGMGDTEVIAQAIATVLEMDPQNPHAKWQRAKLRFSEGKLVAALADVEDALAYLQDLAADGSARVGPLSDPPAEPSSEAPEFRYGVQAAGLRVEILAKLGRHAEAVAVARALVRDHPQYPQAHFLLGNLLIQQGDPAGSEYLTRFRLLSEVGKRRYRGYQNRTERNDLERARFEYEAALDLDPEDSGSLLGLANVLRRSGNVARALDLLLKARRADARPVWYKEWILALDAAGRGEEVQVAWLEAQEAGLSLGPEVWKVVYNANVEC